MTTITKPKRFFMGAFVGALTDHFPNKNNNKQRVNREYDPESGTTFPFLCLLINLYVVAIQQVGVKIFSDAF
ncbi:hypothetical protein F6Q07_21980 [Pectobacterium parmentieri]|uniref:hypothetical protein n=1 Tax=Pectobacterium parmentieri TaxID=1905730 RepID=UPI000EAD9D32|nr:hypothetical protein [Pectobacterium parmentieri]AYH00021.1 hypothetical protein C5E26_03135 [Pectobacterium parmentieri]AYH26257.1 hypothetical protein C5E20_03340 [Pectobacterium parmentieri]AYH30719.1 hypothetical protein C5E19_03220 [Pectobacterium parmentieri]MBI0520748.1 hypothetical protein [Pectobacterium parmentieri]